jgi:hypothetical protein
MNTQPGVPPPISNRRTITYELTRWDLFANWMTVLLRNRILQVFVLVALILNGCITLAPGITTRPLWHTMLQGVVFVLIFAWFLALCQCILGLATTFLLKHRGVVGQHVLEITDQGLIERTAYNDNPHKWPSITRIVSVCGYLYIYVSDTNSHQVPKRCLSTQEIRDFVADLRTHAESQKGSPCSAPNF